MGPPERTVRGPRRTAFVLLAAMLGAARASSQTEPVPPPKGEARTSAEDSGWRAPSPRVVERPPVRNAVPSRTPAPRRKAPVPRREPHPPRRER